MEKENVLVYSLHNSPPGCPRRHEGQGCLFWGVRLLSKPCHGQPMPSHVVQWSLEPNNIGEREGKKGTAPSSSPPPSSSSWRVTAMLVPDPGSLHGKINTPGVITAPLKPAWHWGKGPWTRCPASPFSLSTRRRCWQTVAHVQRKQQGCYWWEAVDLEVTVRINIWPGSKGVGGGFCMGPVLVKKWQFVNQKE